jgi:ketosteroid isomerase-like protein
VPSFTELEWGIRPSLEEWAEVASFDTPGVVTTSTGNAPRHVARHCCPCGGASLRECCFARRATAQSHAETRYSSGVMPMETIRPVYEAVARRDWDGAFRGVHPSFVLKTPDRALGSRTYRGPEEAGRAFQDFFEPFEEVTVEPQEIFERGDRIVVFFLQRARPQGSSAVVEVRAGHLWTLCDGRAVRLEIFPEREKALEAAAISD